MILPASLVFALNLIRQVLTKANAVAAA